MKPVQIRKGVIRAYDSVNHEADVEILGSQATVVEDIPVAHHIGAELMDVGTLCGVLFFAEGDLGVVICTWDGAPDAWVTSALIKDGEVAVADLAFAPTPGYAHKQTTTDQVITQSWATYDTLSQTVTVPPGKTYNVLALGSVTLGLDAWTAANVVRVAIYRDAVQECLQWRQSLSVDDIENVAVIAACSISADATFYLKLIKISAYNTEEARQGDLVLIYWEDT